MIAPDCKANGHIELAAELLDNRPCDPDSIDLSRAGETKIERESTKIMRVNDHVFATSKCKRLTV
jgi:hypothetical protein